MLKKIIRTGAPLQIDNYEDNLIYKTSICQVGEDTFSIFEPVALQKKLQMTPGSSWEFCMIAEDALYYFKTMIIEKVDGEVSTYLLKKPQSIMRRQRRAHFRLSCNFEVTYRIIKRVDSAAANNIRQSEDTEELRLEGKLKEEELLDDRVRQALAVNLSGGGMQIITTEFIEPKSDLLLEFTINDNGALMILRGTVLRIDDIKMGWFKKYRLGLQFTRLEEKERELIIRYIFRQVRKRLGLLFHFTIPRFS
jgi:c-di-GMP-binding flagellar brake protein YcgR